MWYIACFILGFVIALSIFDKKRNEDKLKVDKLKVDKLKVGDIVYLKPTNQKCIICYIYPYLEEALLRDIAGKFIGYRHLNLLVKINNDAI
jgi:hypothetical protein